MEPKYQSKYDEDLLEIQHFKQYPCMMPWVGDEYDSSAVPKAHSKLLVVGESCYLPEQTDIHLRDVKGWYDGNEEQVRGEIGPDVDWMDIRGYVNFLDGKGGKKRVLPTVCDAIQETLSESVDFSSHATRLRHIAFTNFFQRPARQGTTIKRSNFDPIHDIRKANEVFSSLLNVLVPDLVLFVSLESFKASGRSRAQFSAIKFQCSRHPTAYNSRHWNGPNGKVVAKKFLLDNHWWPTPD